MLQIKPVTPHLIDECRKFLTQDLTANVLVLGDCYSPLLEASTLYCAYEDNQIGGVCSVFYGFSKPSIAFGAATEQVKKILLETALREVKDEFISIVPTAELDILKEYASVLQFHHEQQMITRKPRQAKTRTKAIRISEDELYELDKFYTKQCSPGWILLQFEVGPVYCIKQNGEIVSAAGVHICTPYIVQLGNIATDSAYRNRGFASACTNALANKLGRGDRIISLYVRTDNKPAIHMYEELGFVRKREVVFATMRKNTTK
jgi:predicted GNAT family acetyltransferase